MADRPRAGLDANVLIAGIRLPRWPHEVMRAALAGAFQAVLPEQVLIEARRHLPHPAQQEALEVFLQESGYEELPLPAPEQVERSLDLVRSEKDVPIAVALLEAGVEMFVTSDRDFTDPAATSPRFHDRVHILLPAVFLREVLGWSSEALEAIRHRTWGEVLAKSQGEPTE